MNTKILFITLTFILFAFTTFTSCKDDNDFKEVSVTAVENLYEPINEKHVILKASASSGVYFEWERAIAEDRSVVYYDVLFDKEGGDFSDPAYIVSGGSMGIANGVTISHKTLNTIAGRCGIPNGEIGQFIWTVQSSRGLTKTLSKAVNTLSVQRLDGIDLPEYGLFVAGPGSETGDNLGESQEFKEIEDGVFEIYTQLEANENFIVYTGNQAITRSFTIGADKESFKDTGATPGENKVNKTGVYKLQFDFLTGGFEMEEVQKITIFNCATQVQKEFSYVGKGVFELLDYNVALQKVDWGDGCEERYKFISTIDGKEYVWGRVSTHGDRRSIEDLSCFELASKGLSTGDQWGPDPFKFPEELVDPSNLNRYTVDVYIYMTADGPYTHTFDNIRD
ncbi:MAG: SusE domain-containing protein [Tannerellaceae bacterium]|nr:SusE domain-containing protein [Tannerellaceae bacterium]